MMMKAGYRTVTLADLKMFVVRSGRVAVDTECVSLDKLVYCLSCNCVVIADKEDTHKQYHKRLIELAERVEELERKG